MFSKKIIQLSTRYCANKIIKRKYGQKDHLDNPKALLNMLLIGSSVGGAQAKILVAINEKNELLAGDIIHNEPVDYYIVKLAHDKSDIWGMEKNFIEFKNLHNIRKILFHNGKKIENIELLKLRKIFKIFNKKQLKKLSENVKKMLSK